MTEKDKINEMPVKKKGEWAPYMKVGVTIFVTVAACILFFFLVYRFDTISAGWDNLLKSAEPIIFSSKIGSNIPFIAASISSTTL